MTGRSAVRSRLVTARANLAFLAGPLASVALMVAVPDELALLWGLLVVVGVLAASVALIWIGIEWSRAIIRADLRRERDDSAASADVQPS